ncbi:MAG: argininosuccinate synthase [Clostridia bacterium]|nr:MAG: argininosuccinate synthase [Clostridia bacterium]
MAKVVLAYSGGLDTSIIIPWLKENFGYEVVALTADLGQGEELKNLEAKALAGGARKFCLQDVREEFIREFIFPTLKAGAVYEGKYLLGTSFARPLIAKKLVEVAHAEGAVAVAHGATGKGNDQVRFELGVKALDPGLKVIAPWRLWDIRSRSEAMAYAAARGIPVSSTPERPYSLDRNLWHLSHEGGPLEDPGREAPEEVYTLITPPEKAPDFPTYVNLTWAKGIPVALDGEALDPVELLARLNSIAGANGVGLVDMVEDRLVGMKSRGVYECPGGTVLYTAHQVLESLTLDRQTQAFKAQVAAEYARLVYDGLWFSPLKQALDAFVAATQEVVTGTVRLKLYKGNCTPAGVTSPYSLYSQDLATFEADQIYDQKDAQGFINLFGLPLVVQARVRARTEAGR